MIKAIQQETEDDSAMEDYERNELTGPVGGPETDAAPADEARPQTNAAPVVGEYGFSAPQSGRSAYSDAGYVPAADASAVPRSYYCAGAAKKQPREKKPRRGMSAGAVIALCLVCALLGGAVCAGMGMEYLKRNPPVAAAAEPETGTDSVPVIERTAPSSSTVTTPVVSSGSELTPTEIYYNLALNQVVGVTTEITVQNFWGYSSPAAISGSGFVISENGYILTNYHVIEDAVKGDYDIKVLDHDGTEFIATVVGYEADNDVAVLKIDASGLSAATIGDSSSMRVGESVYAVGNPLGELQYTMTEGIVSALDREIRSYDQSTQTYKSVDMFQVSAAINSGNSGGPIYNTRGEVIGIATAKYSSTGVESLGFAIPINDAIKIANDLISDGYVRGKAYLGIEVGTVSASAAQYYGLVQGAIVGTVSEGGCAEKAGLQERDIIVALGDAEITSQEDLVAALKDYHAGDTATMKVYRSGEYVELTLTFDEKTPEVLQKEDEAIGKSQHEQQQQQQQGGFSGNAGDFFNFFFGNNPFNNG